jgi:hypothetical protein
MTKLTKVQTVLGVLALTLVAAMSSAQRVRNHFDTDALFQPPAFFDFATLGSPGPATWKVLTAANIPSLQNYLGQVVPDRPAGSIAVALRRNVQYEDGTWSVAIQRGEGHAGIVFRLADEANFRVLLVDTKSGDARLSVYGKGKPAELARGQAKLDRDWSFLSIAANGSHIIAKWNDHPLLEATDPSPIAGRAGVATAGPGIVGFDEFILDPKASDK